MLTLKLSGILLLLILCQFGIVASVICEHGFGTLRCNSGSIRIIDATYGRSDRITCSYGLLASMISNTNCRAPVTNIVASMCHRKTSCVLFASNIHFSDPCVGTYKYLDVTYTCQ